MSKKFTNTPDAAYMRMVRSAIRKSELTKSERDITLAIVNLWFHHRSGPKGYIHPGRKSLAKKARVSIITVARCLAKLRAADILIPLDRLHGEGQQPTKYRVEMHALLVFCGATWIDEFVRKMPQNDTPLFNKMIHHRRIKMIHSIYNTFQPALENNKFSESENKKPRPNQPNKSTGGDHE